MVLWVEGDRSEEAEVLQEEEVDFQIVEVAEAGEYEDFREEEAVLVQVERHQEEEEAVAEDSAEEASRGIWETNVMLLHKAVLGVEVSHCVNDS